jgi:hypothetical protein
MKSAVALGALVLGILLLAIGGFWSSMFPATSSWTEEKAVRSAQVKERLSNLGPIVNSTRVTMHGGADRGALKAEFDQLMKENEQLNAAFQSAYDSPQTMSKVLKWSGISLVVAGLIGWYAVKNMES